MPWKLKARPIDWRRVMRRGHAPENASSYSTLANPGKQIRLLSLQPGQHGDPIVCALEVTDLAHGVPYEALSYVWGTGKANYKISLGSQTFHVRSSLESALTRLRDNNKVRVLWIDAICINQQDVSERSAQVGLMRDIYTKAERVLVWLGEAADDSDLVMTERGIMENFHAITPEMWQAVMKERRWNAFCQFLERPWWRRIWIIQEVAVAQSVKVLCGDKMQDWDVVAKNIALYIQILATLGDYRNNMPIPENMDYSLALLVLRTEIMNSESVPAMPLLDLMERFRRCEATDSRDKVYGLLGLAQEKETVELRPDYALSTSEVYRNVTRYIMTRDSSFDILAYIDPKTTGPKNKLASWTPDWSTELSSSPLPNTFQVAGETSHDFEFVGPDVQMALTVAMVGKLVVCMSLTNDKRHWRHVENATVKMMGSCNWTFYEDEKSTGEAFRRSLVADNISGTRLSDQDYARFSDWYDREEVEIPKAVAGEVDAGKGKVVQISDQEYMQMATRLVSDSARGLDPHRNRQAEEDDATFGGAVSSVLKGRTMFVNSCMFVGVASLAAKEGDMVCVPFGAKKPWIVRELSEGLYQFVGECYVHGIMDGQIMSRLPEGSVRWICLQ